MKLTGYVIDGHDLDIRPAPHDREWMEKTDQRYAYRCLPLNIANAHGWEILNPCGFTAVWDGGSRLQSIEVVADPRTTARAVSHFGHATLTFHVPCVFQTEPGYDLMVQGPINRPKDGIAPLSGVIETDWAPYTFTMNWIFTRPGLAVRFEQGEPFCHIFPVRSGELEGVEPRLRLLSQEPDLRTQFDAWTASRSQFIADLKIAGSKASSDKWQKSYLRGLDAEGRQGTTKRHRTRAKLRAFAR
jgi:Family of unknown function (DUF6065)